MIGWEPFFPPLSKQDWENFHEEVESVSQRTLQTSWVHKLVHLLATEDIYGLILASTEDPNTTLRRSDAVTPR